MSITESFIEGMLNALPDEGIDKLNKLLDEEKVTNESLSELLKEYDINPLEVLKNEIEAEGAL